MSFDYTKTREKANSLIVKFGMPLIVRRAQTDSTTPWNPEELSHTDYPGYGVVTEFNRREVDGTLVQTGDKKVLLSAEDLQIAPETSDLVVVDGVEYKIVTINPLSPAGTVVLYELQIRA